MIRSVGVAYFKQFESKTFELAEHLVLAGPNNSGKTSLLQAIVAWNFARERWRERRKASKGKQRAGVPVTRKDFTAVPLREMNQLWTNGSIALRKDEAELGKAGFPRLLNIRLSGQDSAGQDWSLAFEFRCQSSEQIYVRPEEGYLDQLPRGSEELTVVHVPAFSGIGVAETRYDRPYQDLLIGQGRAGDILRNLLYELSQQRDQSGWTALVKRVQEIFGVTLLAPEYEGRPFILCDYLPGVVGARGKRGLPSLDVAAGGSGFHQVVLLLAFCYARPATVLLLDEPDAHQHVVLQKEVYDLLRRIATERRCQLIVATHSEVIIDGTSPARILSFYGEPHILVSETDREQVREAIRRLTALDLLFAERSPGVLYVEGETEFNLLRAWASVLDHATLPWFRNGPFWHGNQGRNPREARGHFFALRAIREDYRGLLILDGDNRGLPDREVSGEGLVIERWHRYEAESYLHVGAILRWIGAHWPLVVKEAERYLRDQLPPAAFRDSLANVPFWAGTPASKTLLPGLFEACGIPITKQEYYLIAEQMNPEEVHPDVVAKLDSLAHTLGLGT